MEILMQIFGNQIIILVGLYVLVFLVVLLDLWSGVRKARQRGEFRSSYGLRQTTDKMGRYLNMMLVLTVIDAMQMMAIHHVNPQISFDIPLLPLLTILGAIFVGIIEFKSIYEKADDKDKGRYRDAARLVKELMSNPEARSAVERTLDYLKAENEKKGDG